MNSIIRILFMVPLYSVSAWLQFTFYWHAIYFRVLSECYEAFAIASFFALMCHYLAPDLHEQKQYFRTLTPVAWVWPVNWFKKCCGGERGIWRTPRSGLTWFNVVFVGIYQYCFIRVTLTLSAVISQYFHRYCEESNAPYFGHIWILSIGATSVAIAMYCLIQFYVQLRKDLAAHKPFLKVLAIKLVVFLSFWQIFTISILTSQKILKPTHHLSYPSLSVGLPALALCIEMAIFAIMHFWAFPFQPYRTGSKGTKYPLDSSGIDAPGAKQGGFLGMKAMIDAMNPWDLVKAFARSMRWLFVGVKHRERDSSYKSNSFSLADQETSHGSRGNVHLPIADSFRRSKFDMPQAQTEEGAGLIANAQRTPVHSNFTREGNQDVEDGRQSNDIGVAVAYDPQQSYVSPMETRPYVQEKRQQSGHNVKPSTQWTQQNEGQRDGARPDVHNALWANQR